MGLMKSCRDVARLVSKAEDTGLSRRERMAVRLHQLFCRYCREYGRQLIMLRQIVKRYPALALTTAARARIDAALRRLIGGEPPD